MKKIKKFFLGIKQKFDDWKMRRRIKKKMKEIRERDPFIYD